jgi:diketogulonate reductase-like aldo/keto reductase
MQPHPLPRGLRDQLNPNNNNLALEPGGLSIGDSPRLLDDAVVVSIAQRLEKTPAQVLLAWGIQRCTAVLTGSVTPSRIRENFDVTALPADAVQEINEHLQTRIRFNSVVDGGEPGFAEVPSDR